jgi:hypothetical protein
LFSPDGKVLAAFRWANDIARTLVRVARSFDPMDERISRPATIGRIASMI